MTDSRVKEGSYEEVEILQNKNTIYNHALSSLQLPYRCTVSDRHGFESHPLRHICSEISNLYILIELTQEKAHYCEVMGFFVSRILVKIITGNNLAVTTGISV